MDLEPYKVSNQKPLFMDRSSNPLKLDWNESTIGPSPKVIAKVTEFLNSANLNWYPDVEATQLREKLAEYTDLPVEYISCFGGSDMALEYIARTYLEPNTAVLLSAPTYDNFRVYAQSSGATIVKATYSNPFHPNVKKLLESISSRTRLVYICNPNNPTGAMFSEKEIVRLLERAPQQMFVIDEAYYEFCGMTVAHLVKNYSNIMVIRSFSKAFGLAAMRIGYLISDPDNLEYIHRIKVGKNVNAIAQIAAISALDNLSYTENYINQIGQSKQVLSVQLRELGFEFHITPANFFLVRMNNPAEAIKFLERHFIFVRDRSTVPQLEGLVRITIGTPEQTDRLLKVLSELAGSGQTTYADEPDERTLTSSRAHDAVGA